MHTTPVTHPPPEVLADRDAGLVAAFEMLCERMGKLEEIAEHWLRREREKKMQDGKLDSQLWGLDREVELWRDFPRPTCAPPRPLKEYWKFVNISMSDLTTPANLDMSETRRMKTLEAMARLGLQGRQLRRGKVRIKCEDVGLDSDFIYLADAVSEEMLRAALEREP
ncbi:g465 [Coccomyxa elongata]